MSMYAVVAPGISNVYSNWKHVERIKALYPYSKWVKCRTEQEAQEWLKRNSYGHTLHSVNRYGNTFEKLYINARYKIGEGCLYFRFDCSKLGTVRLPASTNLVEYKGSFIFVKVPDIYLSNETITSHMSAIYNMLHTLGPYVDVNIELDYYSIYYSLTGYSKSNQKAIKSVKDLMHERTGEVSLSLKLKEFSSEEYTYVED